MMASDGANVNVIYDDFDVKMDSIDLAIYLKDKGIPDEVCDKLEQEDVDGQAFLDLNEEEAKSLFSKFGHVKKVLRLQNSLKFRNVSEALPSLTTTCVPTTPTTPDHTSTTPDHSPTTPTTLQEASLPMQKHQNVTPSSSLCSESDDATSIASSASAMNRRFKIPDTWRPSIMNCIEQQSLSPLIRNEIVRDVVAQMFAFEPKPKKKFATEVAQQLVKKYHFWKDIGQGVSGYGSWEKKILERIHNVTSVDRKRKLAGSEEEAPVAKRGRPKQVAKITRYPPLKDTGEGDDDVTIQRNYEKLQKELTDKNPKKEIILALARQTYSFRRKYVLSEDDSISATQLLGKFRELGKIYVIQQEIDLVLSKRDTFKLALADWQTKWIPAILQCGETRGNLRQNADKAFLGDSDEGKIALYILCKLLSKKGVDNALTHIYQDCKMTEDPETIAIDSRMLAPRFAGFIGDDEGQYFLIVESQIVTQTSNFNNALLLWFCLFYTLNLEYPKAVSEVCIFFQEFVFDLPTSSAYRRCKSVTYLSTTTDIQKYVP